MRAYNHWFWNSDFMNWVVGRLVDLDCWLFEKQYGRLDDE